MTDENLYVYGVIDAEEIDIDVSGVDGSERVYTVAEGNVSALVSDVDTTEPERTNENVQAHDEVLRTVMEHDGGRTVVPMQFGMAFKNEETLGNVLRGARPAFAKALEELRGTVELGVKVVAEEGADVDADAVEEAASRLAERSVSEVEGDQFSDRLLLNRSYLVERENVGAFGEAVDELESEFDGVLVQYTGPWAPYNFVDIRVGAES
jgi:hypothetical protein